MITVLLKKSFLSLILWIFMKMSIKIQIFFSLMENKKNKKIYLKSTLLSINCILSFIQNSNYFEVPTTTYFLRFWFLPCRLSNIKKWMCNGKSILKYSEKKKNNHNEWEGRKGKTFIILRKPQISEKKSYEYFIALIETVA